MVLERFVVGRPEHVRVRTDEFSHGNRLVMRGLRGTRNISQRYAVFVGDQHGNRRANIRLREGIYKDHPVALVNSVHRRNIEELDG